MFGPTPQQLADWMLDTMRYDSIDQMADMIAVNMPRPDHRDWPQGTTERAQQLRFDLLNKVHDAPDVESAREALFEMAEALLEKTPEEETYCRGDKFNVGSANRDLCTGCENCLGDAT